MRYEKTMSNIKEVKARSGKVIAVATEGDEDIREAVDRVLFVPPTPELLLPILEIVPLQCWPTTSRYGAVVMWTSPGT